MNGNQKVGVNEKLKPYLASVAKDNDGKVGVNQNSKPVVSSVINKNNAISIDNNPNSTKTSIAKSSNAGVGVNQNSNPLNYQVVLPSSNYSQLSNTIPIIFKSNQNILYVLGSGENCVPVNRINTEKPQNIVQNASSNAQIGKNILLNFAVNDSNNTKEKVKIPKEKSNQTQRSSKLVTILPKCADPNPKLKNNPMRIHFVPPNISSTKKPFKLIPTTTPSIENDSVYTNLVTNKESKGEEKSIEQGTQTDVHCWVHHNEEFYLRNENDGKVCYLPMGYLNLKMAERDKEVQFDNCGFENEMSSLLLKSNRPGPKKNVPKSNAFQENLYSTLGIPNPNKNKPLQSREVIVTRPPIPSLPHTVTKSLTPREPNVPFEPSLLSESLTIEDYKDPELINHSTYNTYVPKYPQNSSFNNANARSQSLVTMFEKIREDIKGCAIADEDGNIPLHLAVLEEDIKNLKKQCIILKSIRHGHINHVNHSHETALMLAVKIAIRSENYEAVKLLIAEKADQSIMDLDFNTPLHYAVKHGCTPVVKELLSAQDATNVHEKHSSDGLTPLHLAAIHGHGDIVRLLINHGVNLNAKDLKSGRTPYSFAIHYGKLNTAAILKKLKANTREPDFAGNVPQNSKLADFKLPEMIPAASYILKPPVKESNLANSEGRNNLCLIVERETHVTQLDDTIYQSDCNKSNEEEESTNIRNIETYKFPDMGTRISGSINQVNLPERKLFKRNKPNRNLLSNKRVSDSSGNQGVKKKKVKSY